MAADVTTLVRVLNGYLDEQRLNSTGSGSPSDLVTRDLFGSSSSSSSCCKDIDLDLQVPSGWEKRLDLKSGKVYLQICNSPISSSSTTTTTTSSDQRNRTAKDVQDLNFLPKDESLDLKLVPTYDYGSVCTLDKVKSALERAKKRSSSRSSGGSSMKEDEEEAEAEVEDGSSSGLLFAGGCPSCLMYVMISKTNPKCPRCDSIVPTPPSTSSMINKKPRIDLNLSLLSSSSW